MVFPLCVMQLAALLRFPCWLTQVGCSTPAVMVSHGVRGCLVTVVLFPPCFSFLYLCSFSFGVLISSRVGWNVCLQLAGLLLGLGWRGLAASSSSGPAAYAVFPGGVLLGLSCSACLRGSVGFAPCVRVLQLRCCLLGLQVGFPCCLFFPLEWVCFWLRCLQSLWAAKAV